MAQKEYLKMADVFSSGVNHAVGSTFVRDNFARDIAWFNYSVCRSREDAAKYAAHAINSHDELVAEVERLRGALSASMSALYEVERVTSELIKNGCYVVDDINAEVSYSIKLVEAIEE